MTTQQLRTTSNNGEVSESICYDATTAAAPVTCPQHYDNGIGLSATTNMTSTTKTTTRTHTSTMKPIEDSSNSKHDNNYYNNNISDGGRMVESQTPFVLLQQQEHTNHQNYANNNNNSNRSNETTIFRSTPPSTPSTTNKTSTDVATTTAADLYITLTEQHQQQQDQRYDDNHLNHNPNSSTNTIQYRSNWENTTLSLPDIDDVSMNYTFIYMEHYKIDLCYSMLSDSFFILGGVSYIILSVWDYIIYYENQKSDYNNNYNESYYNAEQQQMIDLSGDISNSWYLAIEIIAPTVYLINSIIDMYWAEAARKQIQDKQDLTRIWDAARYQLRGISFSSTSVSSNYDYNAEPEVQRCYGCNWLYRLRKYAAHRRTMMAASTFGIAASLAVIAALIRNFYTTPTSDTMYVQQQDTEEVYISSSDSKSNWFDQSDVLLDALSDHVYIVSAIFSMTGKRHRPWLASSSDITIPIYNDSERLEDLGDVLFLIGSLMDATLTDLSLKHLVFLPILSSILWMIDGCLYMRSDIVKANKLRDENKASKALMYNNSTISNNNNDNNTAASTAKAYTNNENDEEPPIKFVV